MRHRSPEIPIVHLFSSRGEGGRNRGGRSNGLRFSAEKTECVGKYVLVVKTRQKGSLEDTSILREGKIGTDVIVIRRKGRHRGWSQIRQGGKIIMVALQASEDVRSPYRKAQQNNQTSRKRRGLGGKELEEIKRIRYQGEAHLTSEGRKGRKKNITRPGMRDTRHFRICEFLAEAGREKKAACFSSMTWWGKPRAMG